MKFDITTELIEEIAETIHNCNWVSGDEIAAYIKACVTEGEYHPEDWSVDGRGKVAIDRDLIGGSYELSSTRTRR